jgi:hypothetical protein
MGVTDGGVTDGARAIASGKINANLNVILFKTELPAEKTKT